jgi:hypothetical protein
MGLQWRRGYAGRVESRLALVIWLTAGAAVVAAGALLRLPALVEPRWYGDEGIFAAIASDLRAGRALYAEAWDQKPPFIFWTYAAIQDVGGTGAGAPHTAGLAVLLATQVTVMAIAWRLGGPGRALAAGLIVAALLATPVIEGNLALTESFMVLPVALAMLTAVLGWRTEGRRRLAIFATAGLLIGVALNYKQVAGWDGLALLALIVAGPRQPVRTAAVAAIGMAAPTLVVAAALMAAGSFGPYWDAVAGSLGPYRDAAPGVGPVGLAARLLPFSIACGLLAWSRLRGIHATPHVLPALWLSASLAGATSSTFAFPHYLQQAVPAFAVAIATARPETWLRQPGAATALGAAACLAAGAVVLHQFGGALRYGWHTDAQAYYENFLGVRLRDGDRSRYEAWFDRRVAIEREVHARISADGGPHTVLVWGDLPWLYARDDVVNATRWYLPFTAAVMPGAVDEVARAITADPPDFLLLYEWPFAPLPAAGTLAAERYDEAWARDGWTLYRRR